MLTYFNRLFLHLKSLRFNAFIPLIIVDIIVPMLLIMTYNSVSRPLFYNETLRICYVFIPFFSVWWVLFVLREYLEADGNELLYTGKSRIKVLDVFGLFMLYLLNVFVIFAVLAISYDVKLLEEFLCICCVCFCYFGLTYLLCYITSSTTLSLMTVLLYTIGVIANMIEKPSVIQYIRTDKIAKGDFVKLSLPLLCAGFVFAVIGVVLNKLYRRYR